MQVIDLEHIKGSITVPELLDALGVDVQNDGKTECPWHEENTPSCHVYEDHLFCYGCGGSGDVVDVLKEYTGWPFVRCLHWLAEKAEDLPDVERVEKVKELPDFRDKFYLYPSLGVGESPLLEMAKRRWAGVSSFASFGLRVCGNTLLIPHWHQGKVVGVKTRGLLVGSDFKGAWPGSLFTTQLYVARMLNPAGHSYSSPATAVICEGESDAWAMASHTEGIDVYALPTGAGTWRDSWLPPLQRYRQVFVCFDNDPAGRQARERVERAVGWDRAVRLEVPSLWNDVNDACANGWRPSF